MDIFFLSSFINFQIEMQKKDKQPYVNAIFDVLSFPLYIHAHGLFDIAKIHCNTHFKYNGKECPHNTAVVYFVVFQSYFILFSIVKYIKNYAALANFLHNGQCLICFSLYAPDFFSMHTHFSAHTVSV